MKPSQLKKWRADNGMTQERLADILGVTKSAIYRWEAGMREIPPFLALALESVERKGGEQGRKGKERRKYGKRHL